MGAGGGRRIRSNSGLGAENGQNRRIGVGHYLVTELGSCRGYDEGRLGSPTDPRGKLGAARQTGTPCVDEGGAPPRGLPKGVSGEGGVTRGSLTRPMQRQHRSRNEATQHLELGKRDATWPGLVHTRPHTTTDIPGEVGARLGRYEAWGGPGRTPPVNAPIVRWTPGRRSALVSRVGSRTLTDREGVTF